ncbi:SAM-dependent methyltransferase [Sphingomonas sp.]|uniref:SAM-dependent methyltransferase n=1 Tax=Sphingomonas sp. TaxID=28214 RepID=UPI003B3A394A
MMSKIVFEQRIATQAFAGGGTLPPSVGGSVMPSVSTSRSSGNPQRGFSTDAVMSRIDHALLDMRANGRRAVRILDVGCADGGGLIETVLHAVMLGFVAIEGRGFDSAPGLVDRARATAIGIHDPRLELTFDVADILAALAEEEDHGADIVLCHYGLLAGLPMDRHEQAVADLQRVAGVALICLGGAQ